MKGEETKGTKEKCRVAMHEFEMLQQTRTQGRAKATTTTPVWGFYRASVRCGCVLRLHVMVEVVDLRRESPLVEEEQTCISQI
jgi:hypothetical protein